MKLTRGNKCTMFRMLLIMLGTAGIIIGGCGPGDDEELGDTGQVEFNQPVANPEAAAAAFRLFYRERVERAVVAYNRFGIFGDSVFATTIGSKAIAKEDNEFEIVPGPTDNNLIGTSAYGVWHAYKVFKTRMLALTLIRMFEGIAFLEQVTGKPGLTVREALPGWTRVMDGVSGTVTRTRFGQPVEHPALPPPALEAEVLSTFYDMIRITYRENPGEYMFTFKPVADLADYAITFSMDERPRFIRVSNCCRSSMRTPQDPNNYPWAGAFWGNHNSRDNLPDLILGILAAMEAVDDPAVDEDLRDAAGHAVEAGRSIGDLIIENGMNLMTIDEHHDYGVLTVSGAVRPHGDPENQDLGSMSACPMAYLARTISTQGLGIPLPEVPLPGKIEELILEELFGCDIELPDQYCHGINDAYFNTSFATLLQSEPFGIRWLDIAELLDKLSPGLADAMMGSFQNDYDDIVESTEAIVYYARITGNEGLEAAARNALQDQTNLMRRFADVIFMRTNLGELAKQRYEAAVFDAVGGLDPIPEDFAGFSTAERRIAAIEALLRMEDTEPKPLMTDEEILDEVENSLADEKLATVVKRYRDTYGMTPPVRRAGEGYEAHTSLDPVWRPVENLHHRGVGGLELLQEIPICVYAPHILDCTWAKLGCTVADLDRNGLVDENDRALFENAFEQYQSTAEDSCTPGNGWCSGADLDRTGEVSSLDQTFMDAAQGCTYTP